MTKPVDWKYLQFGPNDMSQQQQEFDFIYLKVGGEGGPISEAVK